MGQFQNDGCSATYVVAQFCHTLRYAYARAEGAGEIPATLVAEGVAPLGNSRTACSKSLDWDLWTGPLTQLCI